MEYLAELQLARNAAGMVGRKLSENFHQQKTIITSQGKDLKLELDKKAEEIIVSQLRPTEIPILSEENPQAFDRGGSDMYWVVDPLDGSFNYFRKIDSCCVSIALFKDDEPVLGVITDFLKNKSFYGASGYGAYEDDYPIKVTRRAIEESVLATGFPLHFESSPEQVNRFLNITNKFKKVRMFGSAALSLAYVASSKIDCYWEDGILLWDVAAGLAISKAAGAEYEMHIKDPDKYIVDVTCAGNPELLGSI
ncbi:MAG: inositol monophosphatase [Bdellovibrionaceae bacterium]|nr:inositol monophosphatase [Pseudobdellovibrionaceae bacterium]|tara:strand:+ start:84456 stop:85208 length:753 start_codon:yes stop_codon:yes gene_type:complete